MRRFLGANTTGCGFATALAKSVDLEDADPAFAWFVFLDSLARGDIDDLDDQFEAAGADGKAAVAVFPTIREPREVVEVIRALVGAPRWRIDKRQWKIYERPDCLVWLRWRTAGEKWSSVLGFAPFGSMPVHRRAPFVALALWPGVHSNPFRPESPARIGFADMILPKGLTEQKGYDAQWVATQKQTDTLRVAPREGAARPDVTFCLAAEHDDAVTALCETANPSQLALFSM